MATDNPTGGGANDPASEDARTESAVLAFLLDEHPAQLTMDELVLVLSADPRRSNPEDEAMRAVRELAGAGLVHRDGRFLMLSRAALYFAARDVC